MEKRVMMLIVGLIVVVGLPAMALCQEETAEVIEEAPADTGPPFVVIEDYEADMAVVQEQIETISTIPITQADIPLTISTPGSYYLTEDVTAGGTAITVAVDDVTIDLAGFAVVGPDSGENYGIYMSGRHNVEIRNGTVGDFYYGICEVGSRGQGHRIINVRAVSNATRAISLTGSNHLVKDCTVSENGKSADSFVYGIYVGNGGTVTGNRSYYNGHDAAGGVYGILTGSGSTVTGNTANNNGGLALIVYGIYTGSGSTVTGNTSYYNGFEADGFVCGINASGGSTVTGNTVSSNGMSAASGVYGISAGAASTVTGNTSYYNGFEADGEIRGIFAGNGSTVTGNTVLGNGHFADSHVYGIRLGSYCLVNQNTAYDNGIGALSATNMTMGLPGCVYGLNVAP